VAQKPDAFSFYTPAAAAGNYTVSQMTFTMVFTS
jgi:hypothetical protein